jgi:hypothetical protein
MRALFSGVSVVLFILSSVAPAVAGDLRVAEEVIARAWNTDYEERFCGPNIERLVGRFKDAGLSLDSAEVLEIENAGGSMFGMVNAERARTGNSRRPTDEKNWYHHVILVYEGHVFDFDFMSEPTVLPKAEYFEQMFLDENAPPEFPFYRIGRDTKLDGYKFKVRPATSYTRGGSRDTVEEMSFRDYLDRS